MYKIAIIGAGELGSRHLQGVLKIQIPVVVYVIDKSLNSLKKAKERANEIQSNNNIKDVTYLQSIEQIKDEIDVCIIATTANVRFEVLNEILFNLKVNYLILEKFLFQKLEDYHLAESLINTSVKKAWVNCPRRLFPIYEEIKKMINPNEPIIYTAIGGEWGLASNSIHLLDSLNYLNSVDDFNFNYSPNIEVVKGKRDGTYEIYGSLIGSQSNGSEFFVHCKKNNNANLRIQILTNKYFWEIDETNGILYTSSSSDRFERKTSQFIFPYQSDLTNLVCEEILLSGNSRLPSFEISKNIHLGLFDIFLEIFQSKIDSELVFCPIT